MHPFTQRFAFFLPAALVLISLGCSRTSVTFTGLQPKETVDENLKQSFPASAKTTIIVETFSGAITFEPGDATVEIEVLKQGWGETKEEAAENLKKIEVSIKQEGDNIRVTGTNLDKPGQQADVQSLMNLLGPGKTDVRIKAPAQAQLEFKTDRGDIKTTGANNRLKASSGSGNIEAKKNQAAFELTSQYGSITADGLGAGHARTSSGNLEVRGSQKPVVLDSNYGHINVSEAAGVTASTGSGNIFVRASQGPFELHSGYGHIDLKDANGHTKAETASGNIRLVGGQGDYAAKSLYGTVKLEVKDSGVQAETASGNIEIHGCRGPVKAHSGYGQVDVHGEDALLDLENKSGIVRFAGSLAPGESRVKSGFGEMVVALPADAQFKVQARTSYGSIRSQFPLTKTKETANELVGAAGANPTALLVIETNSGNVRIDKKQ